ncbi:hypothetical protein [Streptomyces sp. NPDC059802]|uniref:hypothetical protein n=1 Tax=Streptomyces sp. NPDC059802 TaxID=3346952 RepID=UPI0036646793
MRLNKAWYVPVDPSVYRMTAAGHGTSGSRTARTASLARAYCDPTRTATTIHTLLEGAW